MTLLHETECGLPCNKCGEPCIYLGVVCPPSAGDHWCGLPKCEFKKKPLSQDNKVQFIVHCADWEIDEENSPSLESGLEAAASSTIVDDRTKRTKIFDTEEAALKFANRYIESRKDDKWLAYVEIKECTTKVINKLK
jgi:hypothetical protein